MLKTISVAALTMAALGFAGSAMAQQINNQEYGVDVHIEVAPEVSMWAGAGTHTGIPAIQLLMNGAPGGTNAAAAESSITRLNNVLADINVSVSGSLPNPSVPGGGILFYIFKDGADQATAISRINDLPYTPTGALVWTKATLNTSQEFAADLPTTNSGVTTLVTYGSSSPGELPDVGAYDLDVVWTISAS